MFETSCLRIFAVNRRCSLSLSGCTFLRGSFALCVVGAEPRPYNLPRKKVTFTKISVAPSIDGNCSKATSYKLDAPVSGGAYQDAREVTIEWNDA